MLGGRVGRMARPPNFHRRSPIGRDNGLKIRPVWVQIPSAVDNNHTQVNGRIGADSVEPDRWNTVVRGCFFCSCSIIG